jgi:hypothetical protein
LAFDALIPGEWVLAAYLPPAALPLETAQLAQLSDG